MEKMSRPRNHSNQSSLTVLEAGNTSKLPATGKSSTGSKCKSSRRPDSASSLEILPPDGPKQSRKTKNAHRDSTPCNGRPDSSQHSSSGSYRRAPPIARTDSASRRTPTPTKQVVLQAVRRKDQDVTDWDDRDVTYPSMKEDYLGRPASATSSIASCETSETVSDASSSTLVSNSVSSMASDSAVGLSVASDDGVQSAAAENCDIEDSDQFDTDLDDKEDSSTEEEEEKTKAPNELFMEFLSCVMEQDYENAQKLCKMILMYEPEHSEALSFQNLIEEKIILDEEASESDETDSDEDDSDDDDSDDDSDDESDDSEDHSDSDDASEEGESSDTAVMATDSGLSSATEL